MLASARASANIPSMFLPVLPMNESMSALESTSANGTESSLAAALAKVVLPVPGGPSSSMNPPAFIPYRAYTSGFLSGSISNLCIAAFASSSPIISSKLIFSVGLAMRKKPPPSVSLPLLPSARPPPSDATAFCAFSAMNLSFAARALRASLSLGSLASAMSSISSAARRKYRFAASASPRSSAALALP